MSIIAREPILPKIQSYIKNCQPYPPGKPIEELERELKVKNIIKLASNENPLGASPKAMAALRKLTGEKLRFYPDATHYYLRKALAQHCQVSDDEIIVGNGSNEIIDFLVRSFCFPGENVVSCATAFIAYRVCAQIHGAEYREPKFAKNLDEEMHDIAALCDEKTRLIFLPNPNNPTGTYVSTKVLKNFIEMFHNKPVLIILDYAYWEYARAKDLPDPRQLYKEYSNIVILRTFSKIYGLAGLRLGYGIAHPKIIEPMRKVKMPFNVGIPALEAGIAALQDKAYVKRSYAVNAEGMMFLEKEFSQMGLNFWPSQGNFLLVDFGKPANIIYENLLHKGVIVRPVAGYGLHQHLRISIGNKNENARLIRCLKTVLK